MGRKLKKVLQQPSSSSFCPPLLRNRRPAAVAGRKGSTKVAVPKPGLPFTKCRAPLTKSVISSIEGNAKTVTMSSAIFP